MNDKIRNHLIAFNESHGLPTDDDTLLETLLEEDTVHEQIVGQRRWWNDIFHVVNVGGMLIGYDWAHSTGDSSASELGWEFDWDSVVEVEAFEKVVVGYRVKED
jgi:hypothetical protein